ncbi:helix-turn-helix domain-containing protein [Sinanaerobacter chloroacetimidivorans]|uniref:Helix-turn-helix transcriptional regulator n=1 Tax=Sinanaerobacter chloroacetimidivorans TaxID=2818044 RepID=A0A8J7VXP3_9FIRM|nr:helix-turn-helix transcriptional regulator [Sinanaerobacter chloroacetimidivorans]MBR0596954.1 helix-turn-helix transcriptional regulator [Sinanaerobacter chloroacetimidivorans]
MKYNSVDFTKIKKLCEQKSLSIAQLERELDFGEGTISKWRISSPSTDRLLAVAEFFDVSLDYLTGRSESTKTSDDILQDSDIISIQRARESMDDQNKKEMMTFLKIAFKDHFKED